MIREDSSFNKVIVKRTKDFKIECARDTDYGHYRLKVDRVYEYGYIDRDSDIMVECIEKEDKVLLGTYMVEPVDGVDSYVFQDKCELESYVRQSECYSYLFCNYLRVSLVKLVEDRKLLESIIKLFCKFIGVAYEPYKELKVEVIDSKEFTREINQVTEEFTYELVIASIYNLGYLKENYLYIQNTVGKFLRITLEDRIVGLIVMMSLSRNIQEPNKTRYKIGSLIEVALYALQLHKVESSLWYY